MSKPSYTQAREDFEYLETLAQLTDQVDLDSDRETLMRNPSFTQAAKMYANGCRLWMGEHRSDFDHLERVLEIKERYA